MKSLDMKATIRSFEPVYMARIAQLTNKSNQFNLTTQRMTQAQIEQMAADDSYITLYENWRISSGITALFLL
ncbi:MAG: hypothetical protein ACLURV_05870 [Gallintestinimicrobium sp.]